MLKDECRFYNLMTRRNVREIGRATRFGHGALRLGGREVLVSYFEVGGFFMGVMDG